ncbi:MAG: sulfite exporter TauE/SafE family protein, partial [Chloroflexota bacterium]
VVHWRTALVMGSCGLVTSVGGVTLATHIPGEALKIALGIITMLAGLRMLFSQPEAGGDSPPREKLWPLVAWALPIGLVTGLLGIGGGVLLVPILVMVFKFRMHHAIATSLGIMLFTSAGAAASYILHGLGASGLPADAIGYVHLPTWLILVVTSVSMAQAGAITAHRLPARQLKYVFLAIVWYTGLKMLGLFDWLGWPI